MNPIVRWHAALPRGRTLPLDAWRRRHAWMVRILWGHVVALLCWSLLRGDPLLQASAETLPIVAAALVACVARLSQRVRAVAVLIGLLTSSATVVHLMDGAIEGHFHFFVMVTLLAFYEDWVPYLLSFAYVLAHHGLTGALAPSMVYNHGGAVAHPWRWAGVHALFIGALGIINVLHWRFNEDARAATARSEERYRALVANLPVAVYRRAPDRDWSVDFISDRIEQLSGHPAAELLGGERSYASIVDPQAREAAASEIAAAAERGTFTVEYPIVHADGDTRWVRDIGHAELGDDGSVTSLSGTISDITDFKRLENDRSRIELELRVAQRLESIGQLAAGIAHEINTPIQFIGDSVAFVRSGFDELDGLIAAYRALLGDAAAAQVAPSTLVERIDEAEQDADLAYLQERLPAAFDRTTEGLRRVSEIVGAMRDFGRPRQVEHAPADIGAALRSTLVVAQNEYKYVADVEADLEELPPVSCNIGELNQVFLNLIVNAAHAIADAAGEDSGSRGTIAVRTRREGDDAVVTIGDTGCGIPESIREHVFDPFFTTKEVGRGTGQGLAIARSIVVEKHRGSLTVESEVGRGSTFEIRLPLRAALARAA